jgi:hypothetical protein
MFIESWLKTGFEDEELKCSARLKEFILAIRGSSTMEEKARELASLIDSPDHVCCNTPSIYMITDRSFLGPSASTKYHLPLTTRIC